MNKQDPLYDARIEEVWAGLSQEPRTLNPKWFYDARGSALFEEITRQPEYYVTQCELDILSTQSRQIGDWIGSGAVLAELGAGNGEKAVLLLQALSNPVAYVPIDISLASLEAAVRGIQEALPHIRVQALCQDFSQGFEWPAHLPSDCRCLLFLGSTIGNMETAQAVHWLRELRTSLRSGDKMLLGVDLKKAEGILNAAYNDANGVTAAFNRNALMHLNQELGATFSAENFRHCAFYNREAGRVEMYLESLVPQSAAVGPHVLRLMPGERIHTESSYKYTVEEFRQMTTQAGFITDAVWLDKRGWFSLHGLTVPS